MGGGCVEKRESSSSDDLIGRTGRKDALGLTTTEMIGPSNKKGNKFWRRIEESGE